METLTGRSVFSGKPVKINFQDGKILGVDEAAGNSTAAEFPAAAESPALDYISPGFLDIQVNGFTGIDYSLENLESSQIITLIKRLGASGTSRHLATFVTMDEELLKRNLALCSELMENDPLAGACIEGFHLEGPFISTEDGPRGAHNKKYAALPDFKRFEKWQEAAGGKIKLITLAPELPGAIPFIREAVKSGVKVALGHLAASADQLREAIEAGACCSTHLGNGSHAMLPRLKNYIWEQMARETLTASIICDGFHLPGAVVKVTLRAKGLERLVLISDGALLGGCKSGRYQWNDQEVEVGADGQLLLAGTDFLAGAGHLLDWDIVRFMEFTGTPLGQTISLCTENPARLLDVDSPGFAAGRRADLIVFSYSPGDKTLHVKKTVSSGMVVFEE